MSCPQRLIDNGQVGTVVKLYWLGRGKKKTSQVASKPWSVWSLG